MRHQLTLCSLLLLTSCASVFDYPAEAPEASAESCANQRDDDFDGLADCDDPDCDGYCPEEADACADARNNDGDHFRGAALLDAADPSCWDVAARSSARCEVLAGSAVELRRWASGEPLPDTGWVSTGAPLEDEDTTPQNDYLRLLPGQFVETRAPLPGATAGMIYEGSFAISYGGQVELSLVSPRLGEVLSARFEGVEVGVVRVTLAALGAPESEPVTFAPPADTTRNLFSLRLRESAGRWRLSITEDDNVVASIARDASVLDDEPLTVRIEGLGDVGDSADLRIDRVARPSFDSCGRPLSSPLLNAPGLRAAADSGSAACVVLGGQVFSTVDDANWIAARTLVGSGDFALTYIDAFERFEGARYDPSTGRLHFSISERCERFRESEGVALASTLGEPADEARLVGFDGVGSARTVQLLVHTADGYEVVELVSPSGDPDTYREATRTPWPSASWEGRISIGRIGDSRWALAPGTTEGAAALFVERAGGFVLVDDAFIAPTGVQSAFDGTRVDFATLAPMTLSEGVLSARAYYFARLNENDPSYESAALRRGVNWVDVRFGSEP